MAGDGCEISIQDVEWSNCVTISPALGTATVAVTLGSRPALGQNTWLN